ncbi:PRKCA-binding protein [Lepeophtheirus salmonis]|uniref:PRKCA-binding protein n=1 Tax=Lepeophtheirus salmonis TaxID=72036 RepID=A0A7R8GZ08_LEPSM|nr:PRKCA-binding protein [Lepeophtheirus salmonis]CAF2755524.1 PRKCA-binding protein [Lepeophtheirus salmonis]
MFKKSYMAAMDYSHYLYLRKGTVPNTEEGKLWYQEDTKGMTVSGGTVRIAKDDSNLIGISIGGGAPLCPCLYIVQVFDNTPAARDETLDSGDEILAVNGECVKGKTKVDVCKTNTRRQGTSNVYFHQQDEVIIKYNKLHADPKSGKDLDLILKKLKHQVVDNMSSSTADALGLSRAILCNDTLYFVDIFDLLMVSKEIGDVFCNIGVREPQKTANEAFCQFGEYHRLIEKYGIKMLKSTKPILHDLGTYLTKAIPDTKLTIKKYADCKFEYLSYCLKVKELDDEDYSYAVMGEPLYRVETGNYEYRLILRCRSEARRRFAKLRSDVLVKLELLDNKHVQDIVFQLKRLMSGLNIFHNECKELLSGEKLFPIEVDLSRGAFAITSVDQVFHDEDAGDIEEETGIDFDDVINPNDFSSSLCPDSNLLDLTDLMQPKEAQLLNLE